MIGKIITKTSKVGNKKGGDCGNKMWQAHRLGEMTKKAATKTIKKPKKG
jgi:hypothetical protein